MSVKDEKFYLFQTSKGDTATVFPFVYVHTYIIYKEYAEINRTHLEDKLLSICPVLVGIYRKRVSSRLPLAYFNASGS